MLGSISWGLFPLGNFTVLINPPFTDPIKLFFSDGAEATLSVATQ